MDSAAQDVYHALVALDGELKQADFHQISLAISKLISEDSAHTMLASMLVNANIRFKNSELFHRLNEGKDSNSDPMTSVAMPVGLVSSDDAAVLGRDGFIFLTGGSNDVIGQYSPDRTDDLDVLARWNALIDERLQQAAQREVRYHQIMIPEKISILPDLFPRPVASPTRLLDLLESRYLTHLDGSMHLSARHLFWHLSDRRPVCKKTDSHLAPFGSFLIFRHILKKWFGIDVPDIEFCKSAAGIGDLSFRLFGMHLPEVFMEADLRTLPSFVHTAQKVSQASPEQGSHMGLRQVWHNPEAPISEKIVVFGNSYFSTVENGQSNLSWWFSRWFRDFHFIWTNEVHWDYVDEVRPQIVLWQGVERFLRIVPGQ